MLCQQNLKYTDCTTPLQMGNSLKKKKKKKKSLSRVLHSATYNVEAPVLEIYLG